MLQRPQFDHRAENVATAGAPSMAVVGRHPETKLPQRQASPDDPLSLCRVV
jgi:hypothetical protein